ncbi:MAG: hypothetical protein K940chlam4_00006 [Candidatus Anoxychlamydiales bacterium]|nr:hypothetical protein [Candidatus Anoxychlamydiales bacterium]
MALTKHQKLAKELQNVFIRLKKFYDKVTKNPDSIQFCFSPLYLCTICPRCISNPHMTENALQTMVNVTKHGLIHFSPNQELRKICFSKIIIGIAIFPPSYKKSKIRMNVVAIPWKLEIENTSKSLDNLKKAYNTAILYCASENEMSEWLDWFEKDDRAGSLTIIHLKIINYQRERAILKRNHSKTSYQDFKKEIMRFCGKWKLDKSMKTLSNTKFAPNKQTSIAEAFEKVFYSLKKRTERHHDEFKRHWKKALENLIFKDLNWSQKKIDAFIERRFPTKKIKKTKERWKSSRAIDRQTYSSFIQYFSKKFLKNPLLNKCYGEIVLYLYIAIQAAQDPDISITEKNMLELTTAEIKDNTIHICNQEIEITEGLKNLLKAFIDKNALQRQQKIFPNLTIDRLEDIFRKASSEILPSKDSPILPEAFLTFPHSQDNIRMIAKQRKEMQKEPPKTYYKSPSIREIKKTVFKDKES